MMTTYADACSAAIYARDAAGADVVVGAGVCLTVGLCDFVLLAEPLLRAGPSGIWLGDARQRIPLAGSVHADRGRGTPPGRETLRLGSSRRCSRGWCPASASCPWGATPSTWTTIRRRRNSSRPSRMRTTRGRRLAPSW